MRTGKAPGSFCCWSNEAKYVLAWFLDSFRWAGKQKRKPVWNVLRCKWYVLSGDFLLVKNQHQNAQGLVFFFKALLSSSFVHVVIRGLVFCSSWGYTGFYSLQGLERKYSNCNLSSIRKDTTQVQCACCWSQLWSQCALEEYLRVRFASTSDHFC